MSVVAPTKRLDSAFRRRGLVCELMLWFAFVASATGCGRWGFEREALALGGTADAGNAGSPEAQPPSASEDAGSQNAIDATDAGALDAARRVDGTGFDDTADAAAGTAPLGDAGLEALLSGTWQPRTLPYASGAAASAVLSDGLHYLGGSDHYFGTTRYQHHYVYDATSDTWSDAPADVPDRETWGARAHVYQDRLYLLGGYPNGKRLRVFAANTNGWSSLQAPPVALQWGFASAVIGDALYAFGGVDGTTTNAQGYKYDFAANTWTPVAPIPQNRGRGSLSSAAVGDRIYVLNGNPDDGSTLLQIYDSTTNTWSRGADLPGHFFEAAASCAVGTRIYFLGGASDQDHADSSTTTPALVSAAVNIYDVVTNSWSTGPVMSAPKMWATAQLYNGQLHMLGGLDATSSQILDHDLLVP